MNVSSFLVSSVELAKMPAHSLDDDPAAPLWIYWLNGPFTLFFSIVGALLNLLTIYVVSLYALPKHQRRHRPTFQLSQSFLGTVLQQKKSSAMAQGRSFFGLQHHQQPVTVTIDSGEVTTAAAEKSPASAAAAQEPLSLNSPLSPLSPVKMANAAPPPSPAVSCTDHGPSAWTRPGTPTHLAHQPRSGQPNFYRLYQLGNSVRSDISSAPSSPPSPGGRPSPSRPSSNCTSRPLSRRSSTGRSRVYNFLLWMTMSDTLLLLCSQFMYAWPTLLPRHLAVLNTARLSYWLGNAAMMASVWLMLALTFDRYWTLNCRPFKLSGGSNGMPGGGSSKVRIHKMVAALYLLTLTAALPRFFEYRVDCDNGGECSLQPNPLAQQWWYFASYRIFGGMVLYAVLPYTLLFIFLCKIWSVLKKANQLKSARIMLRPARDRLAKISGQYCPVRRFVRYRLHSDETTDSEIILMFLNLKFMASRLGPWLCDCAEFYQWWRAASGQSGLDMDALRLMGSGSNFLVVVASGVNFFIFYVFSATFRQYLTADYGTDT